MPVEPVRIPTVPPPTEKPTVFQLSLQQQQEQRTVSQPQGDNTAFAHALKMAGIGRGRSMNPGPVAVNTQGLANGYATQNGTASPPQTASPPRMAGVQSITQPQASAAELLMAIGRGRGLGRGNPVFTQPGTMATGQPTFVVPKVGGPASSGSPSVNGSVGDATADFDTEDAFEEEDVRKEIRRLKKKLKMITVLEDKRASGTRLTAEEAEKVAQKDEINFQLETLSID